MTFHAGDLSASPAAASHVVVFARHACGFVLANIPGRGWCTPSGHVEQGEPLLEAAVRETWEEIGAQAQDLCMLGIYEFADSGGQTRYVPAFLCSIDSFGNIPAGSESRGTRCVEPSDVASCYWRWDILLERVFLYADTAWQRRQRRER